MVIERREPRPLPDVAIAPGEILREELEARGMSQKDLADRMDRPEQKISEIIHGRKAITEATALALEKVLGISADGWTNLESAYQLTKARLRERDELDQQHDLLDRYPVRELVKRDLLPAEKDANRMLGHLLAYFGVASFHALEQRQEVRLSEHRITPGSKVSPEALWTWLRLASQQAREVETEPYNESRFRKALPEIRKLTREPVKVFQPRMEELCAAAGVALVIVQQFTKSGANGATRWLSAEKAMIALSTFRGFADMFWFSFFHEAHHVLSRKKKRTFIRVEEKEDGIGGDESAEAAADDYARDALIDPHMWAEFVATEPRSKHSVVAFAEKAEVDPGIVVGRLHHEDRIPRQNLNRLRRRFVWS